MKCSICKKKFKAMFPGDVGHNPEPVKPYSKGTCCHDCEYDYVLPARGLSWKVSMSIKKHNEDQLKDYNDQIYYQEHAKYMQKENNNE